METRRRHVNIKLSRFCHLFTRGNVICLYHALGISPIYLGSDFEPWLNALSRGNTNADVLAALSPLDSEQTSRLIANLREKKFLVASDEEDNQQLSAVQARYLGHPAVAVMYLLVTDVCNLSCAYCFVKNNMQSGYRTTMLTAELAAQSVHFFARQVGLSGVEEPQVIFYGGEPLLNMPVVEAAVETILALKETGGLPRATRMTLITNGTRVTQEIADHT